MNVLVQCDRCKNLIEGIEDFETGMTGGFYRITPNSYWRDFVRKDERIVCDDCMQGTAMYKNIYHQEEVEA
jgi:hypothetical protein